MQRRETKQNPSGIPWLETGCIYLVQILLAGILLYLTILSARVTCTVYGGAEVVEYGKDRPLFHIVIFLAVIWLAGWAERKNGGRGPLPADKRRWNRCFLTAAGAAAVWVLFLMCWPGSDSRLCMESAGRLLRGDFSPWEPVRFSYGSEAGAAGYAYTYPSQNGLIVYMALFYAVFQSGAPYAMQLSNIGFLILGMVCLGRFMQQAVGEERAGRCVPEWRRTALLLILYLPFSFYILFAYGTMPGFGLSCLSLYETGRFVREERWKDIWIGAAAMLASILLKSNYLIVWVALFLYLASAGVFRRRFRLLAGAALLIMVCLAGSRGFDFCMEQVTGNSVSGGIPMTAWAEMGLQEGSRGPGWYNGYNVRVFWENGGEKEAAAEAIRKDISETLSDMKEAPGDAVRFFVKKTASIWAEPTFQGLWIQEVGGGSWLLPEVTDSLLKKGGILNAAFLAAADWIQTLVYAGAFLGILVNFKRMRWDALIPGIIFIGGFLFHLVWEAKGQYTVCYFVFLIPYAWMGIRNMGCRLVRFIE